MSELTTVAIADIKVSNTEAQKARRKRFDKTRMAELAESIKTHGVLQPIILRKKFAKGELRPDYELVAGERRFVSAKAAGLSDIPAVVRQLTDEQVIEIQLIENLQREDVHPMEEAEGYQQLLKHGHAAEELGERVGRSRSYVYGRLKLLALCPKARKAFYADTISASIALLLARIPADKLQMEALAEITRERFGGGSMPYRRAAEYVQETYMLRLRGAPFPTTDAELVPEAGACNVCPKRTGNQPELFDDVKSADVCTDPPCFSSKTRANGERKIAAAKESGQRIIDGAEAKTVVRHERAVQHENLSGYHLLSGHVWTGKGNKTVRKVVGKDAETALLRDPHTGQVHEVVANAVVDKALGRGRSTTTSSPSNAAAKKAKLERKFRNALYQEVRPKLGAPTFKAIALRLWEEMQHETRKLVAQLQGWETTSHSMHDPVFVRTIDAFEPAELALFISDCIYAGDLQVNTYSNSKPALLLEAAKVSGVDAAAVRRSVTPKKKAKKKTAKKAPSKKRVVGAKVARKKRASA